MQLERAGIIGGLAQHPNRKPAALAAHEEHEEERLPAEPVRDRWLLSAIVESSEDAIVSKDLTGIVTTWNKAAEVIFGYAASEIVGQSITLLLPPDRLQEEAAFLDRLKHGERIHGYETVRLRKDGRLVPVSLTISPLKDEGGRIIGASKIARDITQRKQAEGHWRTVSSRRA